MSDRYVLDIVIKDKTDEGKVRYHTIFVDDAGEDNWEERVNAVMGFLTLIKNNEITRVGICFSADQYGSPEYTFVEYDSDDGGYWWHDPTGEDEFNNYHYEFFIKELAGTFASMFEEEGN